MFRFKMTRAGSVTERGGGVEGGACAKRRGASKRPW